MPPGSELIVLRPESALARPDILSECGSAGRREANAVCDGEFGEMKLGFCLKVCNQCDRDFRARNQVSTLCERRARS